MTRLALALCAGFLACDTGDANDTPEVDSYGANGKADGGVRPEGYVSCVVDFATGVVRDGEGVPLNAFEVVLEDDADEALAALAIPVVEQIIDGDVHETIDHPSSTIQVTYCLRSLVPGSDGEADEVCHEARVQQIERVEDAPDRTELYTMSFEGSPPGQDGGHAPLAAFSPAELTISIDVVGRPAPNPTGATDESEGQVISSTPAVVTYALAAVPGPQGAFQNLFAPIDFEGSVRHTLGPAGAERTTRFTGIGGPTPSASCFYEPVHEVFLPIIE